MGEKEVQVRCLNGESITLSISPDKTIQDFKLLLHQQFPRAISSPNFHLCHRGLKLSTESKVGSHTINPGDFLVLIPYAKRLETPQSDQPTASSSSLPLHEKGFLNFAQSQWCDMMREFSYLRNAMVTEDHASGVGYSGREETNDPGKTEKEREASAQSSKKKRKRQPQRERASEEAILCILKLRAEDVLSNESFQKFIEVLDNVDEQFYCCMLTGKDGLQGSCGRSLLCDCPPWTKKILKAFTFLNVFSGFSQANGRRVTVDSLKDVLNRLIECGVGVDMESLNHLSVLYPEVVCFVKGNEDSWRSNTTISIYNLATKIDDTSVNAIKPTPLSTIYGGMKKREASFKKRFKEVLKAHMCQLGRMPSLEELSISVQEADSLIHANKNKKAGRKSLATGTSGSIQVRCFKSHPLSPVEMVEHLRNGLGSQGQIVHVEEIDARVASFTDIPHELSNSARASLKSLGITKLYAHQAESIRASLLGKNVVVATMTSSGKSLCYNIPVLEALMQSMMSCALYLFPTKALAQDQLRTLSSMTEGYGMDLNIGIYDGDTSQQDRTWLRDKGRLLITNPDMLHMSILPFHRQFDRFLSNLRFIVIDETHTYKGPFGCHTSFILRRLQRLCCHVYGSDPSYVFCTATSRNPRQHAMDLANLSTLEMIKKDGSPSGPKSFILWNPPLCLRNLSRKNNVNRAFLEKHVVLRRLSPIMEVSCLLAEMVQHGLRCIAFCKTRKLCELVLSHAREILKDAAPGLVEAVGAYRSGYITKERRRIESEFFSGKLSGIVATNALELGIDVGHVDVTLHLGFPGSVASLWQQAGRSGRRGKPSLAVYVAFEGPLDQYFMKFPQKLFRSPIECCHVDVHNQQVLRQHLLCAAFEHPLSLIYDEKYFGSGFNDAIEALEKMTSLSSNTSHSSPARMWSYIGKETLPSHAVNIRSVVSERYKVIDKQSNEVLEEIEENRAFFQVYEGAVYLNQGNTYLVQELDLSCKAAICQRADLKYYTKARDYTNIHVGGGDFAYQPSASKTELARTTAQAQPCKVTTTWFGFFRIWTRSNEIFDSVELSLPKYSYNSQAVWIRVPLSVKTAIEEQNLSFRAGLHAASHSILNVVPLYIMCNSSDVASECINPHDSRYIPERILLYDQHPGGSGLILQLQPVFSELLKSALELLTLCTCTGETGCPNCLQNSACHVYNEVLHKEAAIMIIKGILDLVKSYFQGVDGSSAAS